MEELPLILSTSDVLLCEEQGYDDSIFTPLVELPIFYYHG